jgi:hypothetical protein
MTTAPFPNASMARSAPAFARLAELQGDWMTADVIASSLGGHPSGNGWIAYFPAHEDTKESLSISDRGGKVLFECFAGCDQAAVLGALRKRGLWNASGQSAGFPPSKRVKALPPVPEQALIAFRTLVQSARATALHGTFVLGSRYTNAQGDVLRAHISEKGVLCSRHMVVMQARDGLAKRYRNMLSYAPPSKSPVSIKPHFGVTASISLAVLSTGSAKRFRPHGVFSSHPVWTPRSASERLSCV